MSLSIKLNSESEKPRVFSPGELVVGKVIFDCSKSEDVAAIIISLKGEVRTKIGAANIESQRAYLCDTTLCEISKTLFQGPYTVAAGTHEYAFQLTVPDHITEPIEHKFEQYDLFTSHTADKALPPSCEMDDSTYVYNNGIVVYELHAKIPRTLRDLKATQKITLYPYRTEDHPNPLPATVSKPISHRLRVADDGASLRALTTTEAFKEKLHPSPKTRTVAFNVSVTAPTAIILGDAFPLQLAIHPDPSSSDGDDYQPPPPPPSLVLKEYHASMQGKFAVRAAFALFARSNDEVGHCEKMVEVSRGMESVAMTLGEAVTLDTSTLDAARFAPTFRSFQMTGSWSLQVRAKVACAGKESTVFIPMERVTLLSPKVRPGASGSAPAYEEVLGPSEGEVPAYESSALTVDMKKPSRVF